MKEQLKDLIEKNFEEQKKTERNFLLFKARKEVSINQDGSGYTIKEGVNKNKVLAHIKTEKKEI